VEASASSEQVVTAGEAQEEVLVFGLLVDCKRSPGSLASLVVDQQAAEVADTMDCMLENFLVMSREERPNSSEVEVREDLVVGEERWSMKLDSRASLLTCRIRTQQEMRLGLYFCKNNLVSNPKKRTK
jgi:hypothetical protein